jgi:hypothetical protein
VHLLGAEASDELAEPDRVCEHLGQVDDDDAVRLPLAFRCATASPSMIGQYGQDVAITSAPCRESRRFAPRLIRLPVRSSVHIRAPPAPRQKPLVVSLGGQSAMTATSVRPPSTSRTAPWTKEASSEAR